MKQQVVCVVLMFVWIGLAGCSKHGPQSPGQQAAPPPKPAMKPAPATPIAEKKEELGAQTWDADWDRIVEESLPPSMLSVQAARAVKSYCPRFGQESEADKRAFWAYVFQALAGAEAGLNPVTDVRHSQPALARKDTVSGRPTRQEGLLQLTYEDSDRYGCDFDWEHDKALPEKDPAKTILQPKNNLVCGVKIMEKQIVDQKKPMLSKSSYWATLRPGTASYRVFAKQMTHVPVACGTFAREAKR